jgi:phage/plasmid-like protein (TIGR03299 family)
VLNKQFGEILVAARAGDIDLDTAAAELMDRVAHSYPSIEGWQRVARSDTNDTLSLNQDSYQVIGHGDFGDILEAVLAQTNVLLETGGCLSGGKQVWFLAKLDEPIQLPGDTSATVPYLALMSRHDGKGATSLRAVCTRIVCFNTYSAAELEGERTGLTYSFIHRGDWKSRMGDARDAVMGARREIKAYAELATNLLGVKVTAEQEELFVREFFPMPPTGIISERVERNVLRARLDMRTLLASPTCEGAGVRGTAYGLVQAGGEYLDHIRKGRNFATRMNRSLLKPEAGKARAMKLALEAAGVSSS